MVKKYTVAIVASAMLLLTGCSQKSDVDASAQKGAESADSKLNQLGAGDGMMKLSDEEMKAQLIKDLEGKVESVYFAFDKYNITDESNSKISANSKLLGEGKAGELKIRIEGNCDEWGTDEYNYALGLKRAKASQDAMIASGTSADRISIVSYGESNPVCTEHNKECWAKNRRADFKLLP
ncbi:MAG: OmpA family protein [Campylobacterales bacterium]|nr:OmpA family protein [Campylobacterales bacterium]